MAGFIQATQDAGRFFKSGESSLDILPHLSFPVVQPGESSTSEVWTSGNTKERHLILQTVISGQYGANGLRCDAEYKLRRFLAEPLISTEGRKLPEIDQLVSLKVTTEDLDKIALARHPIKFQISNCFRRFCQSLKLAAVTELTLLMSQKQEHTYNTEGKPHKVQKRS